MYTPILNKEIRAYFYYKKLNKMNPGIDFDEKLINKVNLNLFDNTSHTENSEFKTYMRVKVGNIVGEITKVENDCLTISYSDTMLTACNNDTKYLSKQVNPKDCIKLDGGLNSPWEINLDSFKTNF